MHIHLQSHDAHTYNIRVHASCPISTSELNTTAGIGVEYMMTKLFDVEHDRRDDLLRHGCGVGPPSSDPLSELPVSPTR